MTQDNTGGDDATPAMTDADIEAMVDKCRDKNCCDSTECNCDKHADVIEALHSENVSLRAAIVHANAASAIRAIPLPTNADLLAEAVKLPEVAALVEAAKNMRASYIPFVEDEFRATYAIDAALAPFTIAKETP